MIRIKNEKQIDGIRRSCKALARLYRELIPAVREGITVITSYSIHYTKLYERARPQGSLGDETPFLLAVHRLAPLAGG